MDTQPSRGETTVLRGMLAFVVSVLLLLFFIWLIIRGIAALRGNDSTDSSTPEAPAANLLVRTSTEIIVVDTPPLASTSATLDDIIANESQYLGKTVTINGYFQRVARPWGFILKEDGITTGQMLIVTLRDATNEDVGALTFDNTQAGMVYEVTGIVKHLTRHTSQEFGLDQDDLKALTFDRQLVIEASSVRKLGE